jgi:hypothetical protein
MGRNRKEGKTDLPNDVARLNDSNSLEIAAHCTFVVGLAVEVISVTSVDFGNFVRRKPSRLSEGDGESVEVALV